MFSLNWKKLYRRLRRFIMTSKILDGHIEITPGVAGGKPHIAGHRITVQDIVFWYDRLGKSADEISAEYGISPADVHSALTYYSLRNRKTKSHPKLNSN